jgi:hypothetical protein
MMKFRLIASAVILVVIIIAGVVSGAFESGGSKTQSAPAVPAQPSGNKQFNF